tara:strand:+ start:239 stop:355 length:117 start_codon:yes stop_codon:yes gene_type:complete
MSYNFSGQAGFAGFKSNLLKDLTSSFEFYSWLIITENM